MKKTLGISAKLLIIYLVIAIPMVAIIVLSYHNKYQTRVEKTLQQRTELAEMTAGNFALFVDTLDKSMKFIGTEIIQGQYSQEKAALALGSLLEDYPVDYVVFADATGTVQASTDKRLIGKNFAGDTAFEAVIAGNELSGIEPVNKAQTGSGFHLTRAIRAKDGAVLGVVGSFVDLAKLGRTLKIEVPSGGANIIDSKGHLVYQSEAPSLALTKPLWGEYSFVKSALSGRPARGTFAFPGTGEMRLVAEVPIQNLGWAAGSDINVDEAIGPIRQEILNTALLTAIILLGALMISLLIARRIVRSLAKLVKSARLVGEGHFSEAIQLDTGDEIEDVARSLDETRRNLKRYVEGLSGIAETGNRLTASLELSQAKETIVRSASQLFGAKASWIFMLSEATGRLEPLVWAGLGAEVFSKMTFSPGQGVIGRVYQSRKPMIVADVQTDSTVLAKEELLKHGITSVIVAPLTIGERTLGALGIFPESVHSWAPGAREMELFSIFASQTAIALENARLFSERIQAEYDLTTERERLAVTLESIGDGVIATDTEQKIILINQVAQNLTGWTRKEASGKTLAEVFNIISEETRQPAENPVDKALRTGSIIGLANHTALIAKDGTEISIADSCAPIRDRHGKVIGAVLVFRDVTEEKNAEEKLKESERRFRGLLEDANLVAVMLDPGGNITFANDFLLNLTGWQRNEVIGKSWYELFVAPESKEQLREAFANAITKGDSSILSEYDIVTRQGERRSIHFNHVALRDPQGKFIGTASIGQDMTERRAFEVALEAERERLATTLGSIGDGVIATDTDGRVVLINKVAQDLTGWTQEAAFGRASTEVFKIIDETTGQTANDPIAKALATGETIELANHTALIAKDGLRISVADSCAPIRDRHNAVIGAVLVFRDVTEKHQAEEALRSALDESQRRQAEVSSLLKSLRSSEERFRSVAQTAGDAIISIGSDGNVVFWNNAAEKIFGHSAGEILGQPLTAVMPEKYRAAHSNNVARLVATGIPRLSGQVVELTGLRKDGAEFPLELSLANWETSDGMFFTGIIRDITERKHAERLSEALNNINTAIYSTLDFDEIMQRVIKDAAEAMDTETASISLREHNHWVARYTHGYPGNVIEKRLSASDVKATMTILSETKKPLVINDALSDERVDQDIMRRDNIKSLLTVPLIVKDDIIGTFNFHFHSAPIPFSEAQIDFAEKLATSVALAVENARLYETERNIADTLQEALLSVPDKIEGLEFGYLYRSATEAAKVGGDFYDVFELECGKVGIVIGDVSGKGIHASALTSRVRNTISAYSNDCTCKQARPSAAQIMSKTNRLLLKTMEAGNFVTVFFGILDLETGKLTYCSAGHVPAIVLKKDGTSAMLKTTSPVIGVFDDLEYHNEEVDLDVEDILVLYTDGVIEARINGELLGERNLARFIENLNTRKAQDIPQHIFNHIISSTDGKLADDVALLTIGFEGAGELDYAASALKQ